MGSNSSQARSWETPVRRVTITAFCMVRTETTQAEWRRVMGRNPSYFKWDRGPVDQVRWHDAIRHCNTRSMMEGLRPAYDGSGNRVSGATGYRLPTKAEWEYAARAGTTGDRYDEITWVAWYSANSEGRTHAVGGKQPNAWGLHDMLGNVWEWTGDWYESPYASGEAVNPPGPSRGSLGVLRGGGWNDGDTHVRAPLRDFYAPGSCSNSLGFRPVWSLP